MEEEEGRSKASKEEKQQRRKTQRRRRRRRIRTRIYTVKLLLLFFYKKSLSAIKNTASLSYRRWRGPEMDCQRYASVTFLRQPGGGSLRVGLAARMQMWTLGVRSARIRFIYVWQTTWHKERPALEGRRLPLNWITSAASRPLPPHHPSPLHTHTHASPSRTSTLQFSLVQFKMVSMRSKKPIILCVPPYLSEVSPTLPLKRFQSSSDWRWPSLVLSRKIVQRFLFPRLSPPGDRWCDVLGFVPAGSVSSFSTLQIFQESSHLWGMLCPSVYLLGHVPSLRHVCISVYSTRKGGEGWGGGGGGGVDCYNCG